MNIFWSFNLLPNEEGYTQAIRALPDEADPKLLTESELSQIQNTKSYIHFIVQHAACGPDNLPWIKVFEDSEEEGGDRNYRTVTGSELIQGKEEALVVFFMCSRKVRIETVPKFGGAEKPKDYSWFFETFKGYHFAVVPGGSLPVSLVPKFFNSFESNDKDSRLDSIKQLVHDYSLEIKKNISQDYFQWADHSLAKVKGILPPQADLGCCCCPKVHCYGPSVEYQPGTRLGLVALHEVETDKIDEIILDAQTVVAELDAHSKWEFKRSGTNEEEILYTLILHSVETPFGEHFGPLVEQLQTSKSVRFHRQIDPDDVLLWEDGQHKAIVERALDLVAANNNTFRLVVAFKFKILQGLRDADYENPYYNTSTYLSHFYDPDEKVNYLKMKGSNMFPSQKVYWGGALAIATGAGEDLNKHAVNQFDLYASKSITLAKNGNYTEAAYNLGIGLHYLTDLSQPMHAANFIAAPGTQSNFHSAFESAMEKRIDLVRGMAKHPVSVGDDFQAIAIALAKASKHIFEVDIVQGLLKNEWTDSFFKQPWSSLVTTENSTPVARKALQNGLNYACFFLEAYQRKL